LFNAYFFHKNGFFERYDRDLRFLLKLGEEAGYDLKSSHLAWRKRGVFMHAHNHPKIFVLYTIAELALAKAGLRRDSNATPPDQVEDQLADGPQWPVYPLLANGLGLPSGEYRFASKASANGTRRCLSLSDFLSESYEIYAGLSGTVAPPTAVERGRRALVEASVR
jgi:hypothetical protein